MKCKDCYWFSGIKPYSCDHEHDPTDPDKDACDLFEDKDDEINSKVRESYVKVNAEYLEEQRKICEEEIQKIVCNQTISTGDKMENERCEHCSRYGWEDGDTLYEYESWDGGIGFDRVTIHYCPVCGNKLYKDSNKEEL